jgi:peroxiredoxin
VRREDDPGDDVLLAALGPRLVVFLIRDGSGSLSLAKTSGYRSVFRIPSSDIASKVAVAGAISCPMNKFSKILWIIAGILFAVATILINYQVKYAMHQQASGSVQDLGNIAVGQLAPNFTIPNLTGKPIPLSANRGQKVVLLDFWATWCGPCRLAMVNLQDLDSIFKPRGLQILCINQGEPTDQVRDFITSHKYTFDVVLDQDQSVAARYGVEALPTQVLVDKEGIVQWISVGYSPSEDNLQAQIEKLTKP